jgi:hypothetical protein
MKNARQGDAMASELVIAIGLVWGHLSVGQFEQAHQLARGCQDVWPEEKRLYAMAIYAAVELNQPLDAQARAFLAQADWADWAGLVLRRADGCESLQGAQSS